MKLLYLTRGCSPHDVRFLNALSTLVEEVHFLPVVADRAGGSRSELSDRIRAEAPLSSAAAVHWLMYPGLVRAFQRRIDSLQPDLVHAGPIPLGATLAALAGFHPLVSMSWGSDLLWEARKPLVRLAARYTLNRSDAFLGDCQAVQRAACSMGMDPSRIVIFPWGVDLGHFSPGSGEDLRQRLGWQKAFILLSTRQFERLYGVEQLAQFFIRTAPSEPSLRMLMLGNGSQQPAIARRFEAAGLLERVHFAGQVAREQLPAYYRAADLYLSGSFSDGSSVSLLEAMACGLPALASNIDGNREWIEQGTNGWLFEVGSVDSLAQEFGSIFSGREHLHAIGLAARSTVEKRANWAENFPHLLDAYYLALEHASGDAR